MSPLNHWSRYAVPRLWAGTAVALGIVLLALARVILTRFITVGTVLGLLLILGGGLFLLLFSINDPRFPK